MQNLGVFQQILEAIAAALQPGATTLRQHLTFWIALFLWLQVMRACWVFLYNGRLLPDIANTLWRGGLIIWALAHFPDLLEGAVHLFVRLGLAAGGNRLTVGQFLDPGEYLRTGMRVMSLLYSTMQASFGLTSLGQAVGYFFLWLGFMASFAVMAVNVLIWQVEMLIASLMLLTLLPTIAFGATAWIGQGALSYVVNKAFRFGVGALIASASFPVLEKLTITTPVSFQSVMVSVIGGWVFAILFWQCNKIASGFLAGMPQLTAGTVLSAAVGSTVTTGAVVAGGIGISAGGVAGLLHAGRAGALVSQGLLGATRAAGSVPATRTGQTLLSQAGPALTAARQGASTASRGNSLMARTGSWAGPATRIATHQTVKSLRQFADVARYVGQDHPGPGVRR